jgi:N-methylhydantoinase A
LAADGTIVGAKAPTTPHDRSVGFFASIETAASKIGISVGDLFARCDRLVHGTTTGTNAIVARDGARTGLITTAGHGDIMFLMNAGGRTAGLSPDEFLDVAATDKPEPLVPKTMIVEVKERVDVDGDVITPLDRGEARRAVEYLVGEQGVQALAISFLWSFKNQVHEHAVRRIVEEVAPGTFVTCASDLVAQRGEYQRTTTAVMNAYIGPLMTRYIESIEEGARQRGFDGRVLFAQCAGGAITGEEAKIAPLRTVHSGPVAGIVSSQLLAEQIGLDNALLTDMGGTTFDVSVIRDGVPLRRKTSNFQRYEVALPMLDVESVGAGGGSIAWTDLSGRLNVGPRSAGAFPGPACYGLGGTEPTVTDADVVLGVLDPATFLEGRMKIDPALSQQAVASVGSRLGLGLYETAAGINRIVDAKMADLIRRMSVMRGLDPRRFVLFAFGGGGPVHATAAAREVGIAKVVVPLPFVAAVWSALGAAVSDVTHVYQELHPLRLPVSADEVNGVFDRLQGQALQTFESEGLGSLQLKISRSLRMKYAMQVHDVELPMAAGTLTDQAALDIDDQFGTLYSSLFGEGSGHRDGGVDVTTFEIRARGLTAKPRLDRCSTQPAAGVVTTSRPVYWAARGGFVDTPVTRLMDGVVEDVFTGPALVEFPDTVVVIHPGQQAEFDSFGNLVVETGA